MRMRSVALNFVMNPMLAPRLATGVAVLATDVAPRKKEKCVCALAEPANATVSAAHARSVQMNSGRQRTNDKDWCIHWLRGANASFKPRAIIDVETTMAETIFSKIIRRE